MQTAHFVHQSVSPTAQQQLHPCCTLVSQIRHVQNPWAVPPPDASSISNSDGEPRIRTERLWQEYFADPSQWWDNRRNKTNPMAPDFRQKSTKESLWIDDLYNPGWIKDMFEQIEAVKKESLGTTASGGHAKQEDECSNYEDPGLKEELARSCYMFKAMEPLQDDSGREMLSLEEALRNLDHMTEPPSIDNLICLLRKCRKKKNLTYAKLVHAHVCKYGLESHRAVSNHIVPLFVECGSLFEAQQVFNKLPYRNEHSWTSLILGYIEDGQLQHALNLYQKMQEDNVDPSSYTLMALLKACARLKDVGRGREIHADVARMGYEKNVFVASTIIDMYAKCSSLVEAQEVFDNLSVRDVVSWNALMSGYVEQGPGQEALKCFEQMQMEGVCPNPATFVCILKACGNTGAIDKVREMHTDIAQEGFGGNAFVGSTLIHVYAKCGSLAEAQEVFDNLPARNAVSWNALIAGYAEHGTGQDVLTCFEQMKLSDVSPDPVTYVCVLRACGKIGALDKGRKLHADIAQKRYESDVSVGNALVDLYIKCGSIAEAQEVFNRLPAQEAMLWTALIAGHAEHGSGQEALKCFDQMQSEGLLPDVGSFICILKVCGNLGAVLKGREIHALIVHNGFEKNIFVGSTLIDMYVKCGSLAEAKEVFDNLPVHNIVSWNALIAGYAEYGSVQEALNCLEHMEVEGISPDAVTFVCVLKACANIGSLEKGQELHTRITENGFERNAYVGNTLINMYGKCGLLAEAQEVFDNLSVQNVVSWNALIAGYAEHGHGQEVLECFDQMQLDGISPDAVTFVSALKACGNVGAIDKGQKIHADVAHKGFDSDIFVGNALVGMYIQCGLLPTAKEVFDKLPTRDVVSWTMLIAGYAEHGPREEALKCFECMQLEGISPDAVTFVCILKACSIIGDIAKGQEIHATLAQRGFEGDVFVGSTLIDMYAKAGLLVEAQKVFDNQPVRNVVSWNALIAAYTEHEPGLEALKYFDLMQLEGVAPDAVTCVCISKACGNVGAINMGQEIHTYIILRGFESDVSVGNTLVDMYGKCGSLAEARGTFERLPVRDVVSWNSMMKGFGLNHEGYMAVQCFEAMQEQGVKVDGVTFTCLLAACSRASLVVKGHGFFNMMREEYGIAPAIDQYTCMVDLLAQSGRLHEAEDIIETMPCFPSEETWMALLSACQINGEAEVGLRSFQQLVQMNSECAGAYVHMAKIYASVGRWDDAYRVEEMRRRAGAKKKPASALIEVNKKVHEFVVGNIQSKEILAMLESLSTRTKEEGYIPNVNLVLRPMVNEEKEATLCQHAEKLAIAFGLLNVPQGQTLRVTKNLRMCSDCHNTSKIISRIEKREIIVRDIYHIHHFKDGSCSCSNVC